jgi:hypothetical protein
MQASAASRLGPRHPAGVPHCPGKVASQRNHTHRNGRVRHSRWAKDRCTKVSTRPAHGKRMQMPERGLEPPPSYLDKNLNLARLPIPPLGQVAAGSRRHLNEPLNATSGTRPQKAPGANRLNPDSGRTTSQEGATRAPREDAAGKRSQGKAKRSQVRASRAQDGRSEPPAMEHGKPRPARRVDAPRSPKTPQARARPERPETGVPLSASGFTVQHPHPASACPTDLRRIATTFPKQEPRGKRATSSTRCVRKTFPRACP